MSLTLSAASANVLKYPSVYIPSSNGSYHQRNPRNLFSTRYVVVSFTVPSRRVILVILHFVIVIHLKLFNKCLTLSHQLLNPFQ